MKAARIIRQTAAVSGTDGAGWGSRRATAKLIKGSKVGKSSDEILVDKYLQTEVMAKRRQKMVTLDQQIRDIISGKVGFFPVVPDGLEGWQKWKFLTWEVVELGESPTASSYIVTGYILVLVAVSSIIAVVETIPSVRLEYKDLWRGLEFFFMLNFTIEFILRLVSCPDKRKFCKTGLNLVDAVVVIPYWVEESLALIYDASALPNLTFVRLLRIGKGVRLVKLGRFSRGVRMLHDSLVDSRDALQLFLVILALSLILCASLMYFFARGDYVGDGYYRSYDNGIAEAGMPELVDPDCWFANYTLSNLTKYDCARKKSPFQSIPHGLWFALVTLMTVGYGEIYPITYVGQVFGTVIVLIGIITLVLPLSIIQSSFVDARRRVKMEDNCERDYRMIRQMVEGEHASVKISEETRRLQEEMEANEDSRIDDLMLLPTLVCLCNQMKSLQDVLPSIEADARKCLEMITKFREGEVNYNCPVEVEAPTNASARVHPSPSSSPSRRNSRRPSLTMRGLNRRFSRRQSTSEFNDVHVTHEDAWLPMKPGSCMTGKEYMVSERELQHFYTRLRSALIAAADIRKSWDDARVDPDQFDSPPFGPAPDRTCTQTPIVKINEGPLEMVPPKPTTVLPERYSPLPPIQFSSQHPMGTRLPPRQPNLVESLEPCLEVDGISSDEEQEVSINS